MCAYVLKKLICYIEKYINFFIKKNVYLKYIKW